MSPISFQLMDMVFNLYRCGADLHEFIQFVASTKIKLKRILAQDSSTVAQDSPLEKVKGISS